MRASIKWLKDYVDFSQTPEELAEMLTMAGVPVENIEYPGREIERVVTGKLVDLQPHPNADRLTVCKVNIGKETLTIATGATNISKGDIVPVALVGAKLPGGVEIGLANFRGVESQGMLCSGDELFADTKVLAPDVRDGILILPPDTPVGVDAPSCLGLDDAVLEFELTPNRADCFSVVGIAREVAALTGGNLKKPMLTLREEEPEKASSLVNITIADSGLCSRFAARVLKNIKIGPSPAWLQHRLQAAGMRPINNIVDVTNFVMLELGLPMHAYDYSLLARHSITVRRAHPSEPLTTLDGVKRELTSDMLVIADAVQAVGIAGVMGGLATEVTAATQTVLLEAASFNGTSIRRTSRTLGLRSEASGRFERGIDTANIIRALDRAAGMLEAMGACTVCEGIVDNYVDIRLPRQVTFSPKKINAYIGIDLPAAKMAELLRRLEFEVELQRDKALVTVPTWRGDITRDADLSEEIARLYGYNNIPSTLPRGELVRGDQSRSATIADRTRDILGGLGFSEIMNFSFSHPALLDKLGVAADSELRRAIPIINPITDEFPVLRTTLLGGLMQTVVNNLARRNEDLRLYELSAVYRPRELPLRELPEEPLMLCGAVVGKRHELSWNQSREDADFYDAKGAVEVLLAKLGITCDIQAGEYLAMHPGKTALLLKDGRPIGAVGEAHPSVLAAFGVTKPVYLFELDFCRLAEHTVLTGRYSPLPRFPATARDLAIIVAQQVSVAEVEKAIAAAGGSLLSDIRLFDIYTGEQVPAGHKSLAFSLTFQSREKTLTDEEIEKYYQNIVAGLERQFAGKLRR